MIDPSLMTRGTRFLGLDTGYADSDLVIFGAPFDGTTSYRPGTRFGPAAIRSESYALESFSPYQDLDVFDFAIHDAGDLDLPFGNPRRVLDLIRTTTAGILADGKTPVMLGGEHLITLGAVEAAAARFPDLHIIHFDAHTDLRDTYLGERLSHATVIRRCWDLVGDGRIFQFGIRSGDRPEFEWAEAHTRLCRNDFRTLGDSLPVIGAAPVYLTVDLDVLDPACFPGTGTPEAGGVSFLELLEALRSLSGLNIVAADLNELAPNLDPSCMSVSLAGKILRELLLILAAS